MRDIEKQRQTKRRHRAAINARAVELRRAAGARRAAVPDCPQHIAPSVWQEIVAVYHAWDRPRRAGMNSAVYQEQVLGRPKGPR